MPKALLAMALIAAAGCSAQSTTDDGIKLGDVDFTATLRSREYVWDWFQPAGHTRISTRIRADLLRLNFARKARRIRSGRRDRRSVSARSARTTRPRRRRRARSDWARTISAPTPIISTRRWRFAKQLYGALSLRRNAEPAGGAFRIQRWHRAHAEECHAGDAQARSHQPAPDRHLRHSRMWAAASTGCTTPGRSPGSGLHLRRGNAHARRLSDRRLGLEPHRLRLCGLHEGLGARQSRRRHALLRDRL